MLVKRAGFSLIEVSIALALLTLLLVASAELTRQIGFSTFAPDDQIRLDSFVKLAKEALKFQSSCNNTLVGPGLNASGITATAILNNSQDISLRLPGVMADGNPTDDIVSAGTLIPRLRITRLQIRDAVDLGGNRYFAQVVVSAQSQRSGTQLKPTATGALYFTVSGGAISSCDNAGLDSTPLCVEMGCTWDPTLIPSCQCPPVSLTCPPLHFMTGIDSAGSPICTPLGGGPCPSGTYMSGLSIGVTDCLPLPP